MAFTNRVQDSREPNQSNRIPIIGTNHANALGHNLFPIEDRRTPTLESSCLVRRYFPQGGPRVVGLDWMDLFERHAATASVGLHALRAEEHPRQSGSASPYLFVFLFRSEMNNSNSTNPGGVSANPPPSGLVARCLIWPWDRGSHKYVPDLRRNKFNRFLQFDFVLSRCCQSLALSYALESPDML